MREWFGFRKTTTIEHSLTSAIEKSNSKVFLVIGEPGSGKTVSMRHFFLDLAKKASNPKRPDAVVPIYLNLKSLTIRPENVTADSIRNWILDQVKAGQDRLIYQFLDNNFEQMLAEGQFFFLLDSFDEIPFVLDVDEDAEFVRQYALALNRFLHAPHKCRGIVTSRPYRSPKAFVGQKLTIRALNNQQIKSALAKYLSEERMLANQIWSELTESRDDLLQFIRNPFYLNLLARFVLDEHKLPDKHYELYKHFVEERFREDESRLTAIVDIPRARALQIVSELAYAMMSHRNVGLEAEELVIIELLDYEEASTENVKRLLEFLQFAKLGRVSRGGIVAESKFGFVHRRFHEYFSARFLRDHPELLEEIQTNFDDRWREVIVLLCEILPVEQLTPIFMRASFYLYEGCDVEQRSHEQIDALATLHFLRDAFRNRYNSLSTLIRSLATLVIIQQFKTGNLLDQKRAIECTAILDQENEDTTTILEFALGSDSQWVQETAIYSCTNIGEISNNIFSLIYYFFIYRYRVALSPRRFVLIDSLKLSSSQDLQKLDRLQRGLRIFVWLRVPILVFSLTLVGIMLLGPIFFFDEVSDSLVILLMLMPLFLVFMSLTSIPTIADHFILKRKLTPELFRYDSKRLTRKSILIIGGVVVGIGVLYLFVPYLTGEKFPRHLAYFTIVVFTLYGLLLSYVFLKYQSVRHQVFQSLGKFVNGTAKFIKGFPKLINVLKEGGRNFGMLLRVLNQRSFQPKNSREIVIQINTFSNFIAKAIYSRNLQDWVPFDTDIEAIIDEAERNFGEVRDNLYKLAEKWSDSIPR